MKRLLCLMLILLFAETESASAQALWSDFSATLLHGNNYQIGHRQRNILTLEYAAGFNWGDTFAFIDRLHSTNGARESYAEWSPRVRLAKLSSEYISNVYFATTIEHDELSAQNFNHSFTNYLVGIGVDLTLPHFNYIQVNGYHRFNQQMDNNYQLTLVFALPIKSLTFDGFIDYTSATAQAKPSLNFTSQLKYNIAPALNLRSTLFLGIEYVFWKNKFGIQNIDERNVNLLIKYHF